MIALVSFARSSCISCQLYGCTKPFINTTCRQSYQFLRTKSIACVIQSATKESQQFRIFRVSKNVFNVSLRNCSSKAGPEAISSTRSNVKKIDKLNFKRLLSLVKPEKWKLGGAVLLLLVSSAVTMFAPFSAGKLIDKIGAQITSASETDKAEIQKQISNMCRIFIAIFIIGGACNAGRIYLMSVAGQRITKALREKVYKSLMRQETGFYDTHKTGELLSRLSSDTQYVGEILTNKVSDGLRSTISTFAGLSMMFYTSVKLSVMTLSVFVPTLAVLAMVSNRYLKKISTQTQSALAATNQVAEERFSNIRVVKTFGREDYESSLYSKKLSDVLNLAYKEAKVTAIYYGLTGMTGNILLVSAIATGGPMVQHSSVTVGQLTSFMVYALYVSLSLGGMARLSADVSKGLGATSEIWKILDRKPGVSYGQIIPKEKPRGQVEFSNISFAYPTRPDVTVLNGFNLTIPAGGMTALVGGSGSGKSTIASLLLRFYDPSRGQISIDGRSISELDCRWLRQNIAFVSQEPVLFSGSIRDNISYGSLFNSFNSSEGSNMLHVPENDVWNAAKTANADNFIKLLPDGLDTVVGERGITLSGGQRQRIAIARALIRDPKVLVLDEATSALDAESESLVQDALEKIMHDRTVLVIAHRLSTVRNADQIAVLEGGKVTELGSYDELIGKEHGVFKNLVRLQTFKQAS